MPIIHEDDSTTFNEQYLRGPRHASMVANDKEEVNIISPTQRGTC